MIDTNTRIVCVDELVWVRALKKETTGESNEPNEKWREKKKKTKTESIKTVKIAARELRSSNFQYFILKHKIHHIIWFRLFLFFFFILLYSTESLYRYVALLDWRFEPSTQHKMREKKRRGNRLKRRWKKERERKKRLKLQSSIGNRMMVICVHLFFFCWIVCREYECMLNQFVTELQRIHLIICISQFTVSS